jgi:hypothetical protein
VNVIHKELNNFTCLIKFRHLKRTTTDHKNTRAIGTKCVFHNEQQDKKWYYEEQDKVSYKVVILN